MMCGGLLNKSIDRGVGEEEVGRSTGKREQNLKDKKLQWTGFS
jgi:hypothetical protein